MTDLPELYKRTSTGAIQQWRIEVDGNKFRTISGQVGGKLTTSQWTECHGKNIGRANETTAQAQALAEANAKWVKQTKKHYNQDIDKCDERSFFIPMSAQGYPKYKDKLKFPVISQPKLDGIRCIVKADGMWTRGGEPVISAPHIYEAVKSSGLFVDFPNAVLDGELYYQPEDGSQANFEHIISLVKKTKPTAQDLAESEKYIQLWVYDYLQDHETDKDINFSVRWAEDVDPMFDMVAGYKSATGEPYIVKTPTEVVNNQQSLDDLYGSYLGIGYEGQMLRINDCVYKSATSRSKDLLKRKEFLDEEFEIVSLNEGLGDWQGYVKSVTLKDKKTGVVFNSGIRGTQEYLQNVFQTKDSYVGKEATCRYQNRTADGVPRFPVIVALHESERW